MSEHQPLSEIIERAKRQLEEMIDLAPQGMMLVGPGEVVQRVNRAVLRILHRKTFTDVLGLRLPDLFPSVDEGFFNGLYPKKGACVTRETDAKPGGAGAGLRTLRFSVVGIDEASGTSVVMLEDVTAERQDALLLDKSRKQEAVHALMGALMHHLNQPLTVITVRAQLLLTNLERAEVSRDDLARTLRDIIDLAMQVSGILRKVSDANHFETETYVEGLSILDIGA